MYLHNRNWNVMFCIFDSSLPGWVGEGVLQGLPQPSGRQEVFLWLSSISLPVFVWGQAAYFPAGGQHQLQVGGDSEGEFYNLMLCAWLFIWGSAQLYAGMCLVINVVILY